MPKPIVAVVGRPNVGKSTLVNRIAQRRDAIVHESAGVTRDRSYHSADWAGRAFVLVDTGGIETARTDDAFSPRIREQAEAACAEASAIIFVVDATVGVTDEDEAVARILRRAKKPVLLVANKLDNPSDDKAIWEFSALGLGQARPVSAAHGHGTGDLLDELVAALPEPEAEEPALAHELRVAIVGRPNVGKSSLTNRFAGQERSIVSEVAGTTRDAVDVTVTRGNTCFRLVDTAGMRKRSLVHEDVEYYSLVRGLGAIDEADLCLLVADAAEGVTEQDQKVAALAIERGCALVLLLNKWDLVRDERQREDVMTSVARRMAFAPWVPVLRVSALTGRSLDRVWDVVERAGAARAQSIPTSALNRLLAQLRESGHSVSEGKRRLRITYANQTGNRPPAVTFFCNFPELVNESFKRYLERRLREAFSLEGTPVRLRFRKKQQG